MGRWTRADVRRLRERMSAEGRTLDEIADEIRHRGGYSKLAAYRMALGWSQSEAVARYREAAPKSFMDQPLLSRLEQFPWAQGSRAPLARELATFAAVYGTAPLRLLATDALDHSIQRNGICSCAATQRIHR